MSTARKRGYAAFDDGFEIEDCPYPSSSLDAKRWRAGWRDRDFEVNGDIVGQPKSVPAAGEYGQKRNYTITVPLSSKEKSTITSDAKRFGMKVSAYARLKILGS